MAENRWMYGDAWERFPVEPGQVWGIAHPRSLVAVHDIFESLPDWLAADALFVDPPWNGGNLNAFYTKAGRVGYVEFEHFLDVLIGRIQDINPSLCYLEMGNEHVDLVQHLLPFPCIQRWPVTYYRKHPSWLLRGSLSGPTDYDFSGIDEARCIQIVAEIELYDVIGDLCMGRGLVGLAAYRAGRRFVGTELNKRRLACLLDSLAKAGAEVVRYV